MRRILVLAAVFAFELILLSLLVDGQTLLAQPNRAAHLLAASGMSVLHFLVSLAALGATFTYLKRRTALATFHLDVTRNPLRAWTVVLHLGLFGGMLAVANELYNNPAGQGPVLVTLFLTLGCAVLVSGLATVAPLSVWARLAVSMGAIWVYASVAALAAVLMTGGWRALWQPATAATYLLVQWILRPLIGNLVVQPESMQVSTGRFGVTISPECSGLEGMGLLLLFGVVWLWMYRKEIRFPRALLLLPAGLAMLFVLNSVRIAALLLIGHAGARQIALQGFHSQAGWIAFNGVAFGLCIAARRIPWIVQGSVESTRPTVNMTAVYLGPLLAIIGAGMVSRAMTGGFEWLYPIRFLAACAAFWVYRREYRRMDWSFTWAGPAVGLLVFGLWMALEWALAGWPRQAPPPALATAPAGLRWGWVAFRVLGAVVAVPVAEELAYRGYLMRRLIAEDFAAVRPALPSLFAWLGSSVLFGVMHQGRWLAGTAAGLLYALVYLRKGKLGEAMVAHAVTNGLIAAAVLALGYWNLW